MWSISNQKSLRSLVCTGFHKSGLSIKFYWNKFKLNHCELSRLLRTCMLNRLPFFLLLFFLFFFVKLDGTKLNRSDGLNFNKFDRCLFFLNMQFYPTKRKFFVSTNTCSQKMWLNIGIYPQSNVWNHSSSIFQLSFKFFEGRTKLKNCS